MRAADDDRDVTATDKCDQQLGKTPEGHRSYCTIAVHQSTTTTITTTAAHPLHRRISIANTPHHTTPPANILPPLKLTLYTVHSATMDQWNKLSQNVGPLGQRLSKGFGTLGQQVGNLGQQARERFGNVEEGDITELPQEYRDLEARVDGLKNAHAGLLKVAKAYDNEGYDYPVSWVYSWCRVCLIAYMQQFGS